MTIVMMNQAKRTITKIISTAKMRAKKKKVAVAIKMTNMMNMTIWINILLLKISPQIEIKTKKNLTASKV